MVTAKGYRVSFRGDKNVLKSDHTYDCTALWIQWNPLHCTFYNGELYLNKAVKIQNRKKE